ncbi:MAG: D-amino-acid transaminase [Hyphomicrobium sp.]
MSRIVYVNGSYRPYAQAAVHVEDRGFQFADAIYEVIEVKGGCLVDATRHLDRLERSLSEIAIAMPMSRRALSHVVAATRAKNHVRDGVVYIQVTRGVAGARDFALPPADTPPTLVVIARSQAPSKMAALSEVGISVITMPDIRWQRSDIKTVMLLPAVLAKNAAKAAQAKEAWLVDASGHITEGASSNAWIVTADGRLVTRQTDARILAGVTRATALAVAREDGMAFDERPFTVEEAYAAREAFVTSATNTVMPVVAIDGRRIGDGTPGPVSRRLRQRFHHIAEISAR